MRSTMWRAQARAADRKGRREARAVRDVPREGNRNQQVHRSVFEEVDTVGKEGYRSNRDSHGELNAKVAEVQDRNRQDGTS